nr:rRNA pseudouridine synthase [Polyangiaceae bacterium]
MEERLQKILARAGVASRRAAEDLITAGRVRVNGRIVQELGTKADPRRDKVELDGRLVLAERPAYIVLHKPRLVVSTLSDPEGRPTVGEIVEGLGARLYPVGRLDFHTSGTLLLTNDGEFSHGLLHPREGVPKTYVAKVLGVPTEETLQRWRDGIELDDGPTAPCDVRFLREEAGKGWLEITLTEGRNQQIRRMGEACGHPVMRLARLSFAGITSEGLRPGAWRPLSPDELTELRGRYGVPRRVRGANDELAAPPRPARPRATGGFGDRRSSRRGSSSSFDDDGIDDMLASA